MYGAEIASIFKETCRKWSEDKVPRLGAALAYYAIFSLAPLMVLAVAIAGLVLGRSAMEGGISKAAGAHIDKTAAEALEQLIQGVSRPQDNITALIIGTLMLFLAASAFFVALQDALNSIWNVELRAGRGVWQSLKERALSFLMVIGTGLVLLALMLASAALSGMRHFVSGFELPGGAAIWTMTEQLFSLAVVAGIFTLLYKYIPDVKISWSDVALGGFLSAVLFLIGKMLIGLYLSHSNVRSTFGAAGSLVVLLIWIYYSAQIFFFGAEFTRVYARRFGHGFYLQPGVQRTH